MYDRGEKLLELKKLGDDIVICFKEKFPNGHIALNCRIGFGNEPTLSISLGLIKDVKDCSNAIRHNDPMHHVFMIFTEPSGVFEASTTISGLYVNPPKDSYLVMQSIKTKYRKTTGNSEKLLKAFKQFIRRLRVLVDTERENIYAVDEIDPKYFD